LSHGKDAQKVGFAGENLRCLWTAFHVAQEMGESLGRGENLFGCLQGQ
jgi:hypothetical protein